MDQRNSSGARRAQPGVTSTNLNTARAHSGATRSAPAAMSMDEFLKSFQVKPSSLQNEKFLEGLPRIEFQGRVLPSVKQTPLISKLGSGGMGAVYLGYNTRLGVPVAVKVISCKNGFGEYDELAKKRFRQEASFAAQVSSPNCVRVFDVDEENGIPFLTMEYVHGRTVSQFILDSTAQGRVGIDPGIAMQVISAATSGLAAAHKHGVIHRDVKPGNIMIPYIHGTTNDDYVASKLLDLGLARADTDQEHRGSLTGNSMSQNGGPLGTAGYMAPEQALDSKSADKRADVFSIGATFYAMLAGKSPFERSTTMQMIFATVHERHVPINHLCQGLPPDLTEIIETCLSKEPYKRFPDAAALFQALSTADLKGKATRPKFQSTLPRGDRQKSSTSSWTKSLIAAAVLILLLLGSVGLYAIYKSTGSSIAPDSVFDRQVQLVEGKTKSGEFDKAGILIQGLEINDELNSIQKERVARLKNELAQLKASLQILASIETQFKNFSRNQITEATTPKNGVTLLMPLIYMERDLPNLAVAAKLRSQINETKKEVNDQVNCNALTAQAALHFQKGELENAQTKLQRAIGMKVGSPSVRTVKAEELLDKVQVAMNIRRNNESDMKPEAVVASIRGYINSGAPSNRQESRFEWAQVAYEVLPDDAQSRTDFNRYSSGAVNSMKQQQARKVTETVALLSDYQKITSKQYLVSNAQKLKSVDPENPESKRFETLIAAVTDFEKKAAANQSLIREAKVVEARNSVAKLKDSLRDEGKLPFVRDQVAALDGSLNGLVKEFSTKTAEWYDLLKKGSEADAPEKALVELEKKYGAAPELSDCKAKLSTLKDSIAMLEKAKSGLQSGADFSKINTQVQAVATIQPQNAVVADAQKKIGELGKLAKEHTEKLAGFSSRLSNANSVQDCDSLMLDMGQFAATETERNALADLKTRVQQRRGGIETQAKIAAAEAERKKFEQELQDRKRKEEELALQKENERKDTIELERKQKLQAQELAKNQAKAKQEAEAVEAKRLVDAAEAKRIADARLNASNRPISPVIPSPVNNNNNLEPGISDGAPK